MKIRTSRLAVAALIFVPVLLTGCPSQIDRLSEKLNSEDWPSYADCRGNT